MSQEAIIKIPVEDEAFQRFYNLFEEYSSKLNSLPDQWGKVNQKSAEVYSKVAESMKNGNVMITAMAAQTAVLADRLDGVGKSQLRFRDAIDKTSGSFRDMFQVIRQSESLFGKVLKLGLGFAAVGAGAVYGMGRLAGSALRQEREARGMGLNVGEMQAFDVDMQQFGGRGILRQAAEAQVDPRQAGWLATLGIDFTAAAKMKASDLAQREIEAVHAAWRRNPTLLSAQSMAAQQLGFSAEDIRNIGEAPSSEIDAARRHYQADKRMLGFSPEIAAKWAALSMTLKRAEVTIESVLIRSLSRLTPYFDRMITTVTKWIEQFSHSKEFGEYMSVVETSFKKFGEFLTDPEFKRELGKGVTALTYFIDAILSAAEWVHKITGTKSGEDIKREYNSDGGIPMPKSGSGIWPTFTDETHNPGNIRHRNFLGLWQKNTYESDRAGWRAMADLVKSYPAKYHADNIASIIDTYNGHGANTAAYITNVSAWTGFAPHEHLDLNNPIVLRKLLAAMGRQESGHKVQESTVQNALAPMQYGFRYRNYIAKPAQVSIYNTTSARVSFSATAAAH